MDDTASDHGVYNEGSRISLDVSEGVDFGPDDLNFDYPATVDDGMGEHNLERPWIPDSIGTIGYTEATMYGADGNDSGHSFGMTSPDFEAFVGFGHPPGMLSLARISLNTWLTL